MSDAASRPRGRYAKGVARRAEILQVALDAYAQSPGERPTLRAIAGRVGLTEAGVLHYFGSMDELFVAILRARDEAAARDFDLTSPQGAWDYLASTTRTPGLARLYADLSVAGIDPGHPASAFLAEHRRQVESVLRTVVTGLDERDLRLVVAAAEGLQLQWLRDPGVDVVADLRRLVEALRARA